MVKKWCKVMGTCDWKTSGWTVRKPKNVYTVKDLQPLFKELQVIAEAEYGHGEGGIHRMDWFNVCGMMTRRQFDDAIEKTDWISNKNVKPPKTITDQGVEKLWERGSSSSNACVVIIKDETKDDMIVSGAFIKDKGIIPTPNREKEKFVINYKDTSSLSAKDQSHRVASIPDAWKWINSQLSKNPTTRIFSIENSYTYAKPKIEMREKNETIVHTEWWGTSPC